MSYPKKVLKFRPTKGYVADLPANELGPDHWGGSIRNVIFRNGFARRIGGSRAAYGTIPVDVLHMLNARVDTTNYWLFMGADEIHALETSNATEVTPSGGLQTVDQPWQWSSALLNGVPVVTNGLDAPLYWDGNTSNDFDTLPDWPSGSTCKSIAAFKYHLFALDLDESGGHFEGKVMWSDKAPPGAVPSSWTAAAGNEAGSTYLADTPGPAMCAVPCRGSLFVYKRSSLYAADYVERGDIFTFRTLFTSSGALTRHAVADINGQHLVVTDGDIILTDGTNRHSIGEARMREYLFASIDPTHYENLFVAYHRAKGEAWICFPESGNAYCTQALVYNVATDSFGVRDLPDVTCAAVGVVNDDAGSEIIDDQDIVIDDDTRFLNQANFSLATESILTAAGTTATQHDTPDNVAVDATIGRYDLTMGDAERLKYVRRVHVRTNAAPGTLLVRVGSRMSVTDSITWSAEQSLTTPAAFVNFTVPLGRFISVEVRSAGSEVWTLSGLDIEYEMRGYH